MLSPVHVEGRGALRPRGPAQGRAAGPPFWAEWGLLLLFGGTLSWSRNPVLLPLYEPPQVPSTGRHWPGAKEGPVQFSAVWLLA